MPDVGQDVIAIMNLHARCQASKSLPHAGGVLDQPAHLMGLFDVIDSTRADWKAGEDDRAQTEAAQRRLLEGLTNGR